MFADVNIVVTGLVAAVVAMLVVMGYHFAKIAQLENALALVNGYLNDMNNVRYWKPESGLYQRRPMLCRDGFSMSVQASQSHYCSPRRDTGPWNAVEIGFPTQPEPLLAPYSDMGTEDGTGDVFGWVPVEVVVLVLNKHGGLVGPVLPETTADKVRDAQAKVRDTKLQALLDGLDACRALSPSRN
jgi:hypothetical protein